MIKWTAIASAACFVPTFCLWGGPLGGRLLFLLYPAPCLIAEALNAPVWHHAELFMNTMLLCEIPAYGILLRISSRLGCFKLCLFTLLAIHITAVVYCFLLKPLHYRGG